MKRRFNIPGLIKDDKGVALTEFCIIIPIVLLFFFAMLQFFEMVQAAQLGNYAAYQAARAYSVRKKVDNAPDSINPETAAQLSAAIALAPVGRLVSGSAGGLGGAFGALFLPLQLSINSHGSEIVKGSGTAFMLLQAGGFSPSIENIGSHYQAVVAINYPQQINVPGLSEMWNVVAGQNIKTSLLPLEKAAGLGLGLVNGTPFVNLPSQSSSGCEQWSGVLHDHVDDPDPYPQ